MQYAQNVLVFAGDQPIYRTHSEDAERLIRDGLAKRRCRGSKVKALDLIEMENSNPHARASHGNPHKYTYLEALGQPVTCHTIALKPISRKTWPIFRAAVVDCLEASKQAEIRALFNAPRA